MALPFDLEGSGTGVCNIWSVAYKDGLTGLVIGDSARDLAGCFDFSNPIKVTRSDTGEFCPPLNDAPVNALNLTVGVVFLGFSELGTNANAFASEVVDPSIPDPTCSSYAGENVWYSATVPASGRITFETKDNDGSIANTGRSVNE